MDRRSLIKNAGMAGVLAAGVAPAVVHAQEVIRWRLASSFPKSLDTLWGGAPDFAQYVSEMTGGKFQITTHAPGELVPAFGVLDAAQSGTIEVAHTAPYYFFGKSPAFGLGSAIPFGLNARQRTAWMYQGNGSKLLGEFYSKYNVVAFPALAVPLSAASAAFLRTFQAARSIKRWKKARLTHVSGLVHMTT